MSVTTTTSTPPEPTLTPGETKAERVRSSTSLLNGAILRRAVVDSVVKLNPRTLMKNPVMFVVEAGGDRSAVTGGTRVLSDRIVVRITARPGETFIDRMIALVEGSERQKTPNEIALNILLAGLTIIFLLATVSLQPFAIYANAEQS